MVSQMAASSASEIVRRPIAASVMISNPIISNAYDTLQPCGGLCVVCASDAALRGLVLVWLSTDILRRATGVIAVNGVSALETFPLTDPHLIACIPSRVHVRAPVLMAGYAVDGYHFTLITAHVTRPWLG